MRTRDIYELRDWVIEKYQELGFTLDELDYQDDKIDLLPNPVVDKNRRLTGDQQIQITHRITIKPKRGTGKDSIKIRDLVYEGLKND
jgi:hypothetical protein